VLVDPRWRPGWTSWRAPRSTWSPLHDAEGSLLARAATGPVPTIEVEVTESDHAQPLYTSGTTSRPKGATMTHRALVHEYVSCIVAMGCTGDDESLHPVPLHHSAGMHVLMLPYLAVGAKAVINTGGVLVEDALYTHPAVAEAVANPHKLAFAVTQGVRPGF
jgi:fatty-acyl-CoA synthase